MKRRGNLRKTLPLLLARGAVVLTIGWVIFLGVAAAAGLTRILPLGSHKPPVAAPPPSAPASAPPSAASARHEQGGDSGRSEPRRATQGGNSGKLPIHGVAALGSPPGLGAA